MLKPHISDADLIRFADGELPVRTVTATETHLRTCSKCRARLDELKRGAEAYDVYHAQLLRPSLEIPQQWSSLSARLKTVGSSRQRLFPTTLRWAAAAFVCTCLVIAWFLHRESPAHRMQQLLTRAATLAPTSPHRRLQVIANGHTWYRAATFQSGNSERGLEQTRALFVKANYSWNDPLSARSFAAWRWHLPSKRDRVFSILDGNGANQFYRLQTETSVGVLHMASLTLRADTLSPVQGAFHFEHYDDVIIEDASEMPTPPGKVEAKNSHPLARPTFVKEVGPKEELRVFAALDAIGADVGESVSVDIAPSKQQIIIAGVGLSPDRERQVRQALAPIANTEARFTSGQAIALVDRPTDTAASPSAVGDAPLRHALERQAGGAQRFQDIADKALDASSIILQQAHALYVLAEKFPPPIASQFSPPEQVTLRSLRRRHAIAIEQATAELKDALRPLITPAAPDETQNPLNTSWEIGAAQLYEEAKLLDASLGRILAGTYSQETGQRIWNKLPDEIQTLEAFAVSQQKVP